MKKAGFITTFAGIIVALLSSYDLFGTKSIAVPLTVTGFLAGIAAFFLGPAFIVFPLHPDKRRKIANISLIFSLSLLALGFLCVVLHIPGARIEIIFAVLIFCFFYGSLSLKTKYEKWKLFARTKSDAFLLSMLSVFDFLGIGSVVLGFLFRIQHWPMADALMITGLTILAAGVLAWNQKFKKEVVLRKQAEDQLKGSLDQIAEQHQKLEEKQKEVIDSITYARRIQRSLLPTEKYIDKNIKRLKKD